MLKLLKQIKPIYIILGLFVIVIIVSALGSRTIEGMTSGQQTTLINYSSQQLSILSDINKFIQAQSITWGSGSYFITNLKNYLELYTCLTKKNYFKSKDLNNNGAVIVSKRDGSYIRENTTDNSGNNLGPDEKLYYYDLGAMDKNSDGTIVAYKNTDLGNFYQDNSGNITANSLSGTNYILQTISGCETVTQDKLNTARALLDNQIALLTSTADKTVINNLLTSLLEITNKIIALTTNTGSSTSSIDIYPYDPSYLGPYRRPRRRNTNDDYYYRRPYSKRNSRRNRRRKSRYSSSRLDDDDISGPLYSHQRRRRNTRMRESDIYDDIDNNHGAGYWKNLYLNNLKTTSNEHTPLYGSLLSPQPTIVTSSLVNPSYSSLLAQSSSPGNTGDASSGVGLGTGTSAAGTSASSGVGMGAAASAAAASLGPGISTRGGPVQPAATGDMYLLSSQNSPTNCPVGGCGTAGSSPNNLRPSVVPPCPPCERCPEPKFDCKRVPRYNSAADNQYLPRPVLNDFSQFGM